MAEDYGPIVRRLHHKTGTHPWTGSVGMGNCHCVDGNGRSWFQKPTAAVMVGNFKKDTFSLALLLGESIDVVDGSTNAYMENAVLEVPGFLVGEMTSSACAHYQLADEVVGNVLDFFRSVSARLRESILTAEPGPPRALRCSRSSCAFVL